MTTPAPTRFDLQTLDQHITKALAALRAARDTSARLATRDTRAEVQRAEDRLNALLDYRSSVWSRRKSEGRPPR